MITPRRVPFHRGFLWIYEGFQLVFKSPFGWMKTMSLWFGFSLLCSLVMVIGPILFSILLPILFAGLMVGCRTIDQGRSLQASHLFAGFLNQPARLIRLGGVNLLGEVLLTLILTLWGGQQMDALQHLTLDGSGNLDQLQVLLSQFTPLLIVLSLIQIVLLMMGWFAPALLVFSNLTTARALTLSGQACAMNTGPFLAYSLGMGALLALAIITAFAVPLLGGLLFMIAVPTIVAAVYASYQDIFRDELDLEDSRWTRVE